MKLVSTIARDRKLTMLPSKSSEMIAPYTRRLYPPEKASNEASSQLRQKFQTPRCSSRLYIYTKERNKKKQHKICFETSEAT